MWIEFVEKFFALCARSLRGRVVGASVWPNSFLKLHKRLPNVAVSSLLLVY
jgi:hypothetical protein